MASTSTSLSGSYLRANTFLRSVLIIVTAYALGMVVAGRSFAVPLFDALGFGPTNSRLVVDQDASSDTACSAVAVEDYAIFAFGVLGAVLIGWMTLFWFMTDLAMHHDAAVRAIARRALATTVGVWFAMDTGFSVAIGEIEHAAFNLPFLSLLAGPIYVMMTNDMVDTKKRK